jgi:hypothetical protein
MHPPTDQSKKRLGQSAKPIELRGLCPLRRPMKFNVSHNRTSVANPATAWPPLRKYHPTPSSPLLAGKHLTAFTRCGCGPMSRSPTAATSCSCATAEWFTDPRPHICETWHTFRQLSVPPDSPRSCTRHSMHRGYPRLGSSHALAACLQVQSRVLRQPLPLHQ